MNKPKFSTPMLISKINKSRPLETIGSPKSASGKRDPPLMSTIEKANRDMNYKILDMPKYEKKGIVPSLDLEKAKLEEN